MPTPSPIPPIVAEPGQVVVVPVVIPPKSGIRPIIRDVATAVIGGFILYLLTRKKR